jgi:hypothetical protein
MASTRHGLKRNKVAAATFSRHWLAEVDMPIDSPIVSPSGAAGAQDAPSASLSQTARQPQPGAKDAASSLARQAQGRMSGLLRGQMEAGADYVALVSRTAHDFAGSLDDKAPEIARFMHMAADRADRFADEARRKSPDELFEMASDYARRNPRVFFGAAIAAGFLLSRFLKSGAPERDGLASYENHMGAGLTGGYGAGSEAGDVVETSRREFGPGGQGASIRGSAQTREEAARRDPTREGSHA